MAMILFTMQMTDVSAFSQTETNIQFLSGKMKKANTATGPAASTDNANNSTDNEEGNVTSGPAITTTGPSVSIEPTETPPTSNTTTADIRLVFTSDLHGAVTTTNFENGDFLREGSMARVSTAIAQARQEAKAENTFLFDIGDVMYDYTTDFIYDRDNTAIQPIYKAMATFGYDAITFGNHEFEYELTYMQNQMLGAGLTDACVLSNVTMTNTGQHVWNKNKIITRTVTTRDGSQLSLNVGVIGETIPKLSSKRMDYTGILSTEDMVVNATREAAELKAAGADVVVVLAHSGIGDENPELNAENASYALTKIPEVDAVLCGHLHKSFPSAKYPQFYERSGIDKTTGLSNGKNLIMIEDSGKQIGIADLVVNKENGSTNIVSRTSTIRDMTNDVAIDENINTNFMGEWKNELVASYSNILGEIEKGLDYENYFGTIEDTSITQLVNRAKMSYAMWYINTKKTDYKDKHVIGVSNYEKYGLSDPLAYIDLKDNLLMSCLSAIQRYKTALYLYNVNGQQLREWVEWSASAYATSSQTTTPGEVLDSSFTISDASTIDQNLLQDAWKNNWGSFYVFDGVEYTIDTTIEPRYDINGNKISESKRVTKLTVNGVEVKDTDSFIVAGNRFAISSDLITQIQASKIHSTSDRCQNIVKEYLEECSMNGTFKNLTDQNWNVTFAANKKYIVQSGTNSQAVAAKKEWVERSLGEKEDYQYYLADFSKKSTTDVSGPNIVATSLNKEITNKDITIKVTTTDVSGIANLKYKKGRYTAGSGVWDSAKDISENQFTCSENDIYSILAVDKLGNRSVYYIRINNINKSVLQAPTVDTYTNRKTKITGSAEPKATVCFILENGKEYSTTVGDDGTFSYALTPQNAGKKVYVYVKDSEGRASARTVVTVKRTGPNKPTLNDVKTNTKKITGKTNDNYVTPVLFVNEETVYVPTNGGKEIYLTSEVYEDKYKIMEVEVTIDENGKYTFKLPAPVAAEALVQVVTIDSIQRKSLIRKKWAIQEKPMKPELITTNITNKTTKIKVYNYEKCTITAKINGKKYTTDKATYVSEQLKYRYTIKIPKSNSGAVVKIYATNAKGDSGKVKATKTELVPNTPKITFAKVKGKKITGTVHFLNSDGETSTKSESKTAVYVSVNGKQYKAKVKANGTFTVKVPALAANTKLKYWAKNVNGTGPKGSMTVK